MYDGVDTAGDFKRVAFFVRKSFPIEVNDLAEQSRPNSGSGERLMFAGELAPVDIPCHRVGAGSV